VKKVRMDGKKLEILFNAVAVAQNIKESGQLVFLILLIPIYIVKSYIWEKYFEISH
jgi:hypothetical protein